MIGRLKGCVAVGLLAMSTVDCGGSAGFLRDSITQVQVQRGGFRVVKTNLSVSVSSGKVFCMIPVDDGQVYRRAMEGLHARAALGPNQMLINLREDVKTEAFLGFYCRSERTLSADVIEFTDGPAAPVVPAFAPVPVLPPRPIAPLAPATPVPPVAPGATTAPWPGSAPR